MLSSAHASMTRMIEESPENGSESVIPAAKGPGGEPCDGLFARIVAVYQSNEYLFSELKSIRKQLASARAYLEVPGGNRRLARARIDHLRARRLAALTMLRANRLQAHALLARLTPGPAADAACA